MRVLNSTEVEVVNGAGWVKDFCADASVALGVSVTEMFIKYAPEIKLPIIGTAAQDLVNSIITQIVTGVCRNIGNVAGTTLEATLPKFIVDL